MSLEILKSDLLDNFEHGFFTRKGGVSEGIFEGLNCGRGSSDLASAVEQNRTKVAAALDVTPENLRSVHQYHSNIAIIVENSITMPPQKADAMVCKSPGMALGILTADCAPVLFADRKSGIVGAAHAGWKGAVGGVLEATLDAMENLGADRANISVAIGPCISQRAYEVGPEFVERILDEDPEFGRFFAGGQGDKAQFDLPGFTLFRLRNADVERAEWIGHCTFSDPTRFYSYRRTTHAGEPDYGRLISVIKA